MFKIYKNIFDDEFSTFVKSNARVYHPGRVGNRINLNQKNRQDSYLKDPTVLESIDTKIYDKIYNDVRETFGGKEIKYREPYKVGFYNGENKGFYNLHTDDSRETKYRCISMVTALSDPEDYEGGVLYFPNLKKEFKLEKNSAIVFESSILHGVTPVTSGQRHVLITFFFDDNGKNVRELLNPSLKKNTKWDMTYRPLISGLNLNIEYKKADVIEIGDTDYSDINKHAWSDEDDFWFEDNDSDTLFVSFAGMGWKESIPTFNFYNFMKSYKVDKLFLRDTGPPKSKAWACRYYLLGMRHNTNSLEETLEFLRQKMSVKKYKKIVGFGCSAGGFAAILFGSHLNFDTIIAFNPQTHIGQYKDDVMKDEYNAPRTCRFLRNQRKDSKLYQDSLDLKTLSPFKSRIRIHFSNKSNRGCDKLHAKYLDDDSNVEIIEHDSNSHLLALELKGTGDLKQIIDDALNLSD